VNSFNCHSVFLRSFINLAALSDDHKAVFEPEGLKVRWKKRVVERIIHK